MKTENVFGGFVRLVDHMGDQLSIVRAARVSYDAEWREHGDANDAKLLKYLIDNRHTSPFEAVTFTFEVMAPIFVFRQWHRHRTWSFNEVSARYAELDMGYYVPSTDVIGKQHAKSKQARDLDAQLPEETKALAQAAYKCSCSHSFEHYRGLLAMGVPRELARCVLPVAAYSRMFATVDLHNLLHFLGLRLHSHAQYEIRLYAKAIARLIYPLFPVVMDHWFKATGIGDDLYRNS